MWLSLFWLAMLCEYKQCGLQIIVYGSVVVVNFSKTILVVVLHTTAVYQVVHCMIPDCFHLFNKSEFKKT